MISLLAFDTATERTSIAVAVGDCVLVHEAAGGAHASAALVPAILALLAEARITLRDIDAIAFGRGPGAFTGLRTACSVAQGLAFGAGKPVLPIDTLLAVAEDCRGDDDGALDVWVAMDARMDEIYAAHYAWSAGHWKVLVEPCLVRPEVLNERWRGAPPKVLAGNAVAVFGERLHTRGAEIRGSARPSARAMLPLARALWQAGGAVDAALALPLYLRDKVAQTTAERGVTRLAKLASAA